MTNLVEIRAGTDYADAIGQLLRYIGPGGPYWRYAREMTGVVTERELQYPPDSDWLQEAKNLARIANKRLIQSKKGIWQLVDPDEWDATLSEERDLAHELAVLMRVPDVDYLLSRLTEAQWEDWREWLRKRRGRVPE